MQHKHTSEFSYFYLHTLAPKKNFYFIFLLFYSNQCEFAFEAFSIALELYDKEINKRQDFCNEREKAIQIENVMLH
jgi:hypothetical protein